MGCGSSFTCGGGFGGGGGGRGGGGGDASSGVGVGACVGFGIAFAANRFLARLPGGFQPLRVIFPFTTYISHFWFCCVLGWGGQAETPHASPETLHSPKPRYSPAKSQCEGTRHNYTHELPNDKDNVLRKGATLTQPYVFPNESALRRGATLTHEWSPDKGKMH